MPATTGSANLNTPRQSALILIAARFSSRSSRYIQVMRPHPAMEGEDEILFWKGTDLRELPTAADAIAAARAWAVLPADLGATLETDRMKTLGRSDGEHQAEVKRRLFPNG